MTLYRLGNITDKKATLKALGVESGGIPIMAKKMQLFYLYIRGLRSPAANILKQDALSIGADLAVPSGAIKCEKSHYDCLLIGTKKHIEILSRKEMAQPFGLKAVAHALKPFLSTSSYPTQIMGIINANDDSFYAGSRFKTTEAIQQIHRMIEEGAALIDIGAVSSRPGAEEVTPETELDRIRPICDAIHAKQLFRHATFSIDSSTPHVIDYALTRGFAMINDITGAQNDEVVALAVKHQARLCIMHKQGSPKTMQNNPHYDDVMTEVSDFFQERLDKCEAMGLTRENILLDVGIGFGKTLEHNLALIKNLTHFQKFGCEILIGASRKSLIDAIISTSIEDRLPGTLAIHLKAVENGASIIRCHDVAEHRQALAIQEALQ